MRTIEKIFMRSSVYAALLATTILVGCGSSQEVEKSSAEQKSNYSPNMNATLWIQYSKEANLLRLQGYKLAESLMQQNMAAYKGDKPRAVIVDIDETILDNSAYVARLVKSGKNYEANTWLEWVKESNADLIAGAADFLRNAESHGIEVFYISNRDQDELQYTVENLMKFSLPFADEAHVLLRTSDNDKTERREQVKQNYHVILLVGDQFRDFMEFNEDFSPDVPMYESIIDSVSHYFVLMPNPMYGDFENLIFNGQSDLSDQQKEEARIKALITK